MRLIAIDPGIHALGIAAFDGGILAWARYLEVDMFERPREFRDLLVLPGEPVHTVVLERPVVYPMHVQRVDPKWLMMLSEVIGASAILMLANETIRVTPSVWKGRVDKSVTERLAREALAPHELEGVELPRRKSLAHNVWDAIGLGLWHLKRTAPCYQTPQSPPARRRGRTVKRRGARALWVVA